MKNLYAWFALLVLLTLFGIVGTMDLHSAAIEHVNYCANVADSVYPDYQGYYRSGECQEKVLRDLKNILK